MAKQYQILETYDRKKNYGIKIQKTKITELNRMIQELQAKDASQT